MGPPGTGKSTFLGSCGRLGPAKLLATKPREANSWLYRETGIAADAEVFQDVGWRPSLGRYDATAYTALLRRIWALFDDDTFDFVLVDPYTDVVDFALHELLATRKAASPGETSDGQSIYGSLKHKLTEITQALTALQFAKKPKHVIVSVHTMPAKEDTVLSAKQGGGTKESADNRAQGIVYEGNVLPMIEGSYRMKFGGEFDAVFFSDIEHTTEIIDRKSVKTSRYVIQVAPDAERHSKQTFGPIFAERTLPNDFAAILQILQRTEKAA